MKRIIIAAIIAMAPVVASADEYHTVSWFAAHPAERAATLRFCQDNAGLAPHNPNCINADEANWHTTQIGPADGGFLSWHSESAKKSCRFMASLHVTLTGREAAMYRVALGPAQ